MVIAFRRCCLDVAEFQEAFDMFDDNRDGKISRDELVKMMTRLGQMTSEEEITSIMTKADKDSTLRNGVVTRQRPTKRAHQLCRDAR